MFLFNADAKFTSDKPSSFDTTKPFKNIQIGTVTTVGKVQVSTEDKGSASRDARFNADTHAIRCRIVGAKYDNKLGDDQLANCFPLLPRHLNFVPKVNEMVLVLVFGEDEKFGDRWYIGPLISSEDKLLKDTIDGTASANLQDGTTAPGAEISKQPSAIGVYADPQHVIIEGRNNTDIIQRDSEILLRGGKFITDQPLMFNEKNPAYIQIKHNVLLNNIKEERSDIISVNNIVANKINLLTYHEPALNGETFDLTNVDSNGVADYISEDMLAKIVDEAHPAVFGDTLVKYLGLMREALVQHVHNGNGNEGTDRNDRGELAMANFVKEAKNLENEMISNNIRIN